MDRACKTEAIARLPLLNVETAKAELEVRDLWLIYFGHKFYGELCPITECSDSFALGAEMRRSMKIRDLTGPYPVNFSMERIGT